MLQKLKSRPDELKAIHSPFMIYINDEMPQYLQHAPNRYAEVLRGFRRISSDPTVFSYERFLSTFNCSKEKPSSYSLGTSNYSFGSPANNYSKINLKTENDSSVTTVSTCTTLPLPPPSKRSRINIE